MIQYLVVHCSASPQGRGDTASTIHRWHLERGFDGIGYHRVVLEDGTVEFGRPDYWTGAHVKGYNTGSLGVCLIGEGGDATEAQIKALSEVLTVWKIAHPQAVIVGHNDLDSGKNCPCFDVKLWWTEFVGGLDG